MSKWVALWVTPICAWRGDLDEARQWLAMAQEDLDRNEVQNVVHYQTLEAIVLLAEGKPAEALQSAEVALERRAEIGLAQVGDAFDSALQAAFDLGRPGEDRRAALDRRAGASRPVDSLSEGDRRPLRSTPGRVAGRCGVAEPASPPRPGSSGRSRCRSSSHSSCSSTPSGLPARAGSTRQRRSPPRHARSSSGFARRRTSSGSTGCR